MRRWGSWLGFGLGVLSGIWALGDMRDSDLALALLGLFRSGLKVQGSRSVSIWRFFAFFSFSSFFCSKISVF